MRRIVSSSRLVHTREEEDGFYVVGSSGEIHGRKFELNDIRFSKPKEFDVNFDDIKELIEQKCELARLNGFKQGIRVAQTIKMRHFENHKLMKPFTSDELYKMDDDDILKSWGIPS